MEEPLAVFLGPSCTGKSSVIARLCGKCPDAIPPSRGISSIRLLFPPHTCSLWDTTASATRYSSFEHVIQKARFLIFCFDPSSPPDSILRVFSNVKQAADFTKQKSILVSVQIPATWHLHSKTTFQDLIPTIKPQQCFSIFINDNSGIENLRNYLCENIRKLAGNHPSNLSLRIERQALKNAEIILEESREMSAEIMRKEKESLMLLFERNAAGIGSDVKKREDGEWKGVTLIGMAGVWVSWVMWKSGLFL
jgi:GTPase SAR1 family protein